MLIWIILIIGGALGYLGFRKGILVMFISLFNLMIAIYVGVFSTPLIVKAAPDLEMGYYAAFCMLLLTGLLFVLLEGLSWYIFLRGADIIFPELFDRIGGAVCGFLGGYALLALLVLAFCMMPVSRRDYAKGILPVSSLHRFSSDTTSRICNMAAGFSLECLDGAAERTMEYLIALSDRSGGEPTAESQADFNRYPLISPSAPAGDTAQ